MSHARSRTAVLAVVALALPGLAAPTAVAAPPDPSYTYAGERGVDGVHSLNQPTDVVIAGNTMYAVDSGHSRIWIEDLTKGVVTLVSHDDWDGATFVPEHLAVHEGAIYVPYSGTNKIYRFGLDGADRGSISGSSEGTPDDYYFGAGIDIAADGTIYAIDPVRRRVTVLPTAGGTPRFIGAGSLTPGDGEFHTPVDLALAPDGTLYVVDASTTHRVQRFSATGEFIESFGGPGDAPGKFLFPSGIAVDGSGLVYVADAGNERVQVLEPSGSFLTSIAPALGQPGSFRFGFPGAVAFDGSGRLYVANGAAVSGYPHINRVVMFDPVMAAWTAPTLSGTPGIGQVLTSTPGLWPGGVAVTRQWLRSGAAIPGATGATYRPTGADAGHLLGVRVTGTFGSRGSVATTLAAGTVPKVASTVKLGATKAKAGAKPKVRVTVSGLTGASLTGKVTVKRGSKVLATATLKASHRGKITISVPKQKVGKHQLTATFVGNTSLLPSSSARARLTVTKAKPKVSFKLVKKKISRSAKAKVKVVVKVAGIAGPTGKLRIYDGKKRLRTVTLKAKHRGRLTVTLPRLKAGKHRIKVVYAGSSQTTKKTSAKKTLTVRR